MTDAAEVGCRARGCRVNPQPLWAGLIVRFRRSRGLAAHLQVLPTLFDGNAMHRYRSHTCGALRATDIGQTVRLSGWCHRIREHGGGVFVDLRGHYGVVQVVADPDSPAFRTAETLRSEWVVKVDGRVRARPAGTENPELPTGAVEVFIREIEVLSAAGGLTLTGCGEQCYP